MVGETNRAPFDLPEAEGELVGGFHTEYSSMKFALFFLAEYINMVTVSALATTLFLGGWRAPWPISLWEASNTGYWPILWWLVKVQIFIFVFIWLRGTLPRIRIDQMMSFAWKFMVPMTFICMIAVAVSYYSGGGFWGWISSFIVIAVAFPLLTLLLKTRQNLSTRTYHFAE